MFLIGCKLGKHLGSGLGSWEFYLARVFIVCGFARNFLFRPFSSGDGSLFKIFGG